MAKGCTLTVRLTEGESQKWKEMLVQSGKSQSVLLRHLLFSRNLKVVRNDVSEMKTVQKLSQILTAIEDIQANQSDIIPPGMDQKTPKMSEILEQIRPIINNIQEQWWQGTR